MSLLQAVLPQDSFKRGLLSAFLAIWAVSCINVPYPKYFAMQHVPTVLGIALLVMTDRRWPLSRASFFQVIVFLLIHVLGARYLYSYTPYDDWSQQLLGFRVTDVFGFERNHYDRLVHFAFGLLFILPAWQLFDEHLRLYAFWPAVLAICCVMAASAIYEIIEWGMAMIFAHDWAEAYNGQQGDVWDAQRDMALAAAGGMIGWGFLSVFQIRR